MLMIWVNVDLYMALKQILFSIVFSLDFVHFFFVFCQSWRQKKIGFSSVVFNIQKSSVSLFGSVDRLRLVMAQKQGIEEILHKQIVHTNKQWHCTFRGDVGVTTRTEPTFVYVNNLFMRNLLYLSRLGSWLNLEGDLIPLLVIR